MKCTALLAFQLFIIASMSLTISCVRTDDAAVRGDSATTADEKQLELIADPAVTYDELVQMIERSQDHQIDALLELCERVVVSEEYSDEQRARCLVELVSKQFSPGMTLDRLTEHSWFADEWFREALIMPFPVVSLASSEFYGDDFRASVQLQCDFLERQNCTMGITISADCTLDAMKRGCASVGGQQLWQQKVVVDELRIAGMCYTKDGRLVGWRKPKNDSKSGGLFNLPSQKRFADR